MIYQGHAKTILKRLEANLVDMCLTSPPYWGLRDYGHEDQLGVESTAKLYIEHMTEIFHEVKRILKPEGTLWLNIGDSYSGSGKGAGDTKPDPKFKGGGRERSLRPERSRELPAKCLCMVPERLAWSMIQAGWILRNKIVWHKPNAMPNSAKDRLSNKWEYIFLFSKKKKYYFDLDSIRDSPATYSRKGGTAIYTADGAVSHGVGSNSLHQMSMRGKNPGDVFEIPTQPFPEAHFAVFPEMLCEKPIKAGCPKGGTVLDPFCGAGTVGVIAKELGRKFIGIDIKKEYCDLAKKRIAQSGCQNELY